MTLRIWRCAVLALLLLSAAVVATTPAAADEFGDESGGVPERVDVLLMSGETLEDVTYEVDRRFHVLKLNVGDETRNVSFRDVAALSVEGRDVTELLLGEGYGAAATKAAEAAATEAPDAPAIGTPVAPTADPVETDGAWLSEDSAEYRAATAATWSTALRAAANYSMPMGDYYTGMEDGVGFEGEFWIAANHYVGVQFTVSRSGMKPPDELTAFAESMGVDMEMTATRYAVSGMVYKHQGERGGGLGMLYGRVGLGLIDHEITVSSIAEPGHSDSGSESKLFVTTGGGVVVMLTERLGLDLGATIDQVFISSTSDSYWGSVDYSWIFDLRAGGVFFF